MKIKILCTLGPASLRGDVIRALEERGVDLFRINLSHTPPEAVEPTIALIRRYSHVPICLDTQGAQVRCGKMAEGSVLTAGTTVVLHAADPVLIDRGDLSREIPVEYVPYYQKAIVRQANRWNTPVYVATNLLESMVTGSRATIAEMNDIANTLLDGVHGLVLAAETAMGVDPVGAVDAVMRCIKSFEHTSMGSLLEEDRLGRIG